MELLFSISAEQLDAISRNNELRRSVKNAESSLWLSAFVERLFLFWLPLLAPAILAYFFLEKNGPEPYIAIIICAILYYFIWRCYFKGFLANRPKPVVLTGNSVDRAIERVNKRRLDALSGSYSALCSASALKLTLPSGKTILVPWSRLICVGQDDDFYYLSTRFQKIFDNVYLLAKRGSGMDQAAYQSGLEYILSRAGA
ncbi:MAG TPA: hypothetical protein VJA19_23600 [Pseudomonas sp.]|nr:hypothetical protein [Pseudomonas sp.]